MRTHGDQRFEDASHLALLDNRHLAISVEDRQPERVDRPQVRACATDAIAQLLGGPGVVCDRGHDRGFDARCQEVAEPFGENPGLARSGRSDDAGCPTRVEDGSRLVICQTLRSSRARRRWGDDAEFDGFAMDDWLVEIDRTARSTIDPDVHSVWRPCVAGSARIESCGPSLHRVPPGRLAASQVVGVRPHHVGEAFEGELVFRAEVPRGLDRAVPALEVGCVDEEPDDNWFAFGPYAVEAIGRRPRIAEGLESDLDDLASCERFGHDSARRNDGAASQLRRSWEGHGAPV